MAQWDPAQYERFRAERSRPFFDLLARVPELDVRHGADLGCGTGELTLELARRWPAARFWGVDNSAAMLARAQALPAQPGLGFVETDLARWRPDAPLDLAFSNAAFQWVPGHPGLLAHLASALAPGGVLAVQLPHNYHEPSHVAVRELLAEPAWRRRCPDPGPAPAAETPERYLELLRQLGFAVEMWRTIYYHQLPGPEEVVEWLKGTRLRPVLSALAAAEQPAFLAELGERMAAAYPPQPGGGVVFPFPRLFFVARR